MFNYAHLPTLFAAQRKIKDADLPSAEQKLEILPAPTGNTIAPLTAEMATLCIDGGKKAKMRPGDVLGALTGDKIGRASCRERVYVLV